MKNKIASKLMIYFGIAILILSLITGILFTRFEKGAYPDNESGTGLGLAIAKEIGDRHNIQIGVESKVGIGTSFIFYFKD